MIDIDHLTQEQHARLSELVDLFFDEGNDLTSEFQRSPDALAVISPWGDLYDLPYTTAMHLLIHLMGLQEQVRDLFALHGPVDGALKVAGLEMSSDQALSLAAKKDSAGMVLSLTMLLEASARSMSLYGRNMHALLAGGGVESICKAISVDPTCVGSSTVQRTLLEETLVGGRDLRKAIGKVLARDSMVRKARTKHAKLRLLYKALTDIDSQVVWGMTEEERYILFSEVLGRYDPGGKLEDAARSLTATFKLWELEFGPAK